MGNQQIQSTHFIIYAFSTNVSFSSVNLTYISRSQHARVRTLFVKVFDLFSLAAIAAKLILESGEDTVVKSAGDRGNVRKLDQNGTFVIADGLGALGLKLYHLLSRLEAGYIVIFSRQANSDDTKLVFDELKVVKISVQTLRCDITDFEQVLDAASYCRMKLPPVKGVINGTMTLKVSLLKFYT